MMRSCFLAMLLSLCVFPAFARSENATGASIEWLTCDAEIVTVGRVEKIVTTRGSGSVFYEDCTVQVKEVIKGKVQAGRLVFCLRGLSDVSPAKRWMRSEDAVLLFLSKSKGHGSETHLDGMLVPTRNQIPLSVIDLSAPDKYVLDTRFHALKDKEVILDTCRKAAKRLADHLSQNPGGRVEAEELDVPFGSEAHSSLYAGSACYLKAPVFKRKRQK